MVKKILFSFLISSIFFTNSMEQHREKMDIEINKSNKRKRESEETELQSKKYKKDNDLNDFEKLPAELRLLIMALIIDAGADFSTVIKSLINFASISKENYALFNNNFKILLKRLLGRFKILPIFSKRIPEKIVPIFKECLLVQRFTTTYYLGENIFINQQIDKIETELDQLIKLAEKIYNEWTIWTGVDPKAKMQIFSKAIVEATEKIDQIITGLLTEEKIESSLSENFLEFIINSNLDGEIKLALAYRLHRVFELMFSIKKIDQEREFYADRRHKFYEVQNLFNKFEKEIDQFKTKKHIIISIFPQADPFKIKKQNLFLALNQEIKTLIWKILEFKRIVEERWKAWETNLGNLHNKVIKNLANPSSI